jgi:hypothetical protein
MTTITAFDAAAHPRGAGGRWTTVVRPESRELPVPSGVEITQLGEEHYAQLRGTRDPGEVTLAEIDEWCSAPPSATFVLATVNARPDLTPQDASVLAGQLRRDAVTAAWIAEAPNDAMTDLDIAGRTDLMLADDREHRDADGVDFDSWGRVNADLLRDRVETLLRTFRGC